MPLPTIFFSTNTGSNSYHAGCIQRVYAEINTPSICSKFQIIVCITENPIEILQQLQVYREEIVFFYFGGRDEHFQGLIDASFRARFGSLFDYLAHLPHLDLVFLKDCLRETFVQPLLNGGLETVVGTPHHLPQTQTTEFAIIFCQQYLVYKQTTGAAYDQAINGSGILPGPQARQFVGLHGDSQLRLRRWWQWEFETKPPRADSLEKLEQQLPMCYRAVTRILNNTENSQPVFNKQLFIDYEYRLQIEVSRNDAIPKPVLKQSEIQVSVYAEDMDIKPTWVQTLELNTLNNINLLNFTLKPHQLGWKPIRIDFYHQRNWLAKVELYVFVLQQVLSK